MKSYVKAHLMFAVAITFAFRSAICQAPAVPQEDGTTKHDILNVEVEPSVRLEVPGLGRDGQPRHPDRGT
jgi:hypothetical protein